MRWLFGVVAALAVLSVVGALIWRWPAAALPRHEARLERHAASIPPTSPASILVVEQTQFTSVNEFDPGTLRVLLRNPQAYPVRLTGVTLDDAPVPAFGIDLDWRKMTPLRSNRDRNAGEAHIGRRVAGAQASARHAVAPGHVFRNTFWARIRPGGTLPSGGAALFTVKLSSFSSRRMEMRINGLTSRDQAIPETLALFQFDPVQSPLSIARIAFAEGGERVFAYVANNGAAPQRILRLEIDGEAIASEDPRLWMPRADIPVNGHAIIGFVPEDPFKRGEWVTWRVVADGGGAIGQVRAFWGFPMGVEGESPPMEWGLDPATRLWRPHTLFMAYTRIFRPR